LEALAAGAPGMPAAVGLAGSKAARTESVGGKGLAVTGAALGFFAEAVALEEPFLAEVREALDLPEVLPALEDLLDDFVDDLAPPFAELEGLAVLFPDLAGGCASSVAAPAGAGSTMQQANVDKSATTRRTVRPRMESPQQIAGAAPVSTRRGLIFPWQIHVLQGGMCCWVAHVWGRGFQ